MAGQFSTTHASPWRERRFIIQALLGRDIAMYGDSSQTRAFCYFDDLINGLVRVMGLPTKVVGPISETRLSSQCSGLLM